MHSQQRLFTPLPLICNSNSNKQNASIQRIYHWKRKGEKKVGIGIEKVLAAVAVLVIITKKEIRKAKSEKYSKNF